MRHHHTKRTRLTPIHAVLLCTLTLLATSCATNTEPEPLPASDVFDANVAAVLDGDTIKVTFVYEVPDSCHKQETVRLIGVDTPELNLHKEATPEYFAEEAFWYTNRLYGTTVGIELDAVTGLRDRYGRLLAYVWTDGALLNHTLIKEGYGYYPGTFPFMENRMKSFLSAQETAKENGKGLWGNYER